jgi:hypothetical protein
MPLPLPSVFRVIATSPTPLILASGITIFPISPSDPEAGLSLSRPANYQNHTEKN